MAFARPSPHATFPDRVAIILTNRNCSWLTAGSGVDYRVVLFGVAVSLDLVWGPLSLRIASAAPRTAVFIGSPVELLLSVAFERPETVVGRTSSRQRPNFSCRPIRIVTGWNSRKFRRPFEEEWKRFLKRQPKVPLRPYRTSFRPYFRYRVWNYIQTVPIPNSAKYFSRFFPFSGTNNDF